jgi:hypothetical protein
MDPPATAWWYLTSWALELSDWQCPATVGDTVLMSSTLHRLLSSVQSLESPFKVKP